MASEHHSGGKQDPVTKNPSHKVVRTCPKEVGYNCALVFCRMRSSPIFSAECQFDDSHPGVLMPRILVGTQVADCVRLGRAVNQRYSDYSVKPAIGAVKSRSKQL